MEQLINDLRDLHFIFHNKLFPS